MKKGIYVDTAVIERKKMPLPEEISTTRSWLCREVSRSHRTHRKQVANKQSIGLTSKEGQNIISRLDSLRNLFIG